MSEARWQVKGMLARDGRILWERVLVEEQLN